MHKCFAQVFIAVSLIFISISAVADDYRSAVEADWALQEQGKNRSTSEPEAILEALQRGEALLADLGTMPQGPDTTSINAALDTLRKQSTDLSSLNEEQRAALYHKIRWQTRELALQNPLFAGTPLVFMERKRFICQMLHEYMAYFYDYGDVSGGGVYILDNPGVSMDTRDLLNNHFPRGNFTTLALSHDGKTIYFAYAERAPEKPDFYSENRRFFHLYAMDTDGGNLRQLTSDRYDDFDPCPLPDGGIAFMSTRRGGFTRCNGDWEPIEVYTLHRMDADGSNIRTLSYHETNEWHPSVLNNGSIIYTRWDYVDRSAAHFHGLWTSNPDGSNPKVVFGSYTQRINACYQARAIPGSNKIAFIAGAHHADVGGALVLLDPARATLDPESGEDRLDSIEVLTPEICFPEAPDFPKSYFHSPWPLSENYFIAAYSHDPLPGMSCKTKEDTETGIYLFDRFGNLELLYRKPGISAMYPVPLTARSMPPTIPASTDPALGEEGEFMLTDLNRSHFAMPENRPIAALRIFQMLPKGETHAANKPRIGHANAEGVRMLLGTVPVEADGSAYFRAPARKPLAFQAVDASGRAVQGMRSATYLQPGERRSCVGCHEPMRETAEVQQATAMRRAPSIIQPGPEGSNPMSFQKLMQPILDKHCVQCHDAKEDSAKPGLLPTHTEFFTAAYDGLHPYLRWYEWGGNSITPIVTRPGNMPSDMSPLPGILTDATHAPEVELSDTEWRTIYLWLDANVPFYGTYSRSEQLAQRNGEPIPAPTLQ